ncbi:MAG: helix-turn-helix transcriptional regulator [Lachnospiraceae bacterium]|nr:helix-turn-helix transcriptional regulator [Lachnospiraceae bacterium]
MEKEFEAPNYNSVNIDFSGYRNVDNAQELVDYYKDSNIRIWLNDGNYPFDTHWHNALEILMPVDEPYKAVVKETTYVIQPGEFLIIPPRELHYLPAPTCGSRFIFLIDTSPLAGIRGFTGLQALLLQPVLFNKEHFPAIHSEVYHDLLQIRNTYYNMNEYAELTIYSLLITILVKIDLAQKNIADMFPNVRLYKQKEYKQKFTNLLEYLNSHYMEDLDLEQVSAEIGFSKFHFSRLFKQYTGYTFCDYVNYCRLRVAEEMLAKPDCSITEIALQSGFPSISTFNRLFKQHKGCSPSEYRAKNTTDVRRHNSRK